MKHYFYTLPHVITLTGLALAGLAAVAVVEGRFDSAARLSLLVLLVDRIDGTLARALRVRTRFPNTSGEVLDIITDLVGLTFVPMLLFWRSSLFVEGTGIWLLCAAAAAASWKYSRKESFLQNGYSVGAPPIFFSLFLFYFLRLPDIYATLYAVILIVLVVSPVTSTPTMSVAPMPNMKQPKAPPVVEWLSPPATNMPGLRWPRSGRTT